MSTFGHDDPVVQCDVSSEAANLRRQVYFLRDFISGNSLTTATLMCGRCPPHMYGEHVLNNIRLVETHCDALRRAAHSLDLQAFSGVAAGSEAW